MSVQLYSYDDVFHRTRPLWHALAAELSQIKGVACAKSMPDWPGVSLIFLVI